MCNYSYLICYQNLLSSNNINGKFIPFFPDRNLLKGISTYTRKHIELLKFITGQETQSKTKFRNNEPVSQGHDCDIHSPAHLSLWKTDGISRKVR